MRNKGYSYLFGLLLFVLFVPRVYALSYDVSTKVSNVGNSLYEIKVSLINIKDTSYGLAACSLGVEFSDGAELSSSIRSLGSWTMTPGSIYLFDTGNPALSNTELFLIPVKVTKDSSVSLVNIECSDGNSLINVDDKIINLTYEEKKNNVGNNNNNSNNNNNDNNTSTNNSGGNVSVVKDSNCDLSNIILSDGVIEFDPAVTDYYIDVDDIDSLVVEPILASNKATFTINKLDDKIVINVIAEDDTEKVYNIYVNTEISEQVVEEKKDYTPIFIGIICVLVLINIIRIVRNKKLKG